MPESVDPLDLWLRRYGAMARTMTIATAVVVGLALFASGVMRAQASWSQAYAGWGIYWLAQLYGVSWLFHDPFRMKRLRTPGQMVIATLWNTILTSFAALLLYVLISVPRSSNISATVAVVAPFAFLGFLALQAGLPLYAWWAWLERRREEREPLLERRTLGQREFDEVATLARLAPLWSELAATREHLDKVAAKGDPNYDSYAATYNTILSDLRVLADAHKQVNWVRSASDEVMAESLKAELSELRTAVERAAVTASPQRPN